MSDLIDQQQKGTTMSKYIDLAPQIASMHDQPLGTMRVALGLLDEFASDHPDQVPGQTITDAGLGEIWEAAHAGKGIGSLTLALKNNGITVAEPEPTNSQQMFADLEGLTGDGFLLHGRHLEKIAKHLTELGWVKAPGGDDECGC